MSFIHVILYYTLTAIIHDSTLHACINKLVTEHIDAKYHKDGVNIAFICMLLCVYDTDAEYATACGYIYIYKIVS